MKRTIRLISMLMATGLQVAALPAFCMIPRTDRDIDVQFINSRDYARGMNFTLIRPVASLRDFTYDDIARIIPRDLNPTNDGGNVATQILDHSISNFFNSDRVKNSDIGRTAHRVEKSMEGEAGFGGKEEGSTRHSFKFAMRAAQTKAQLEYTGLTNAELTYQIADEKMNLEIHEDLGASTKIVFNHINTPDDRTEMLSLRWKW